MKNDRTLKDIIVHDFHNNLKISFPQGKQNYSFDQFILLIIQHNFAVYYNETKDAQQFLLGYARTSNEVM